VSITTIEGFAVTLSTTQYALLMTALVVAESQVGPHLSADIEALRTDIVSSFQVIWGDN
jgi:hypothetical protein